MTNLPKHTMLNLIQALQRNGFVAGTSRGTHAIFRHPAKDVLLCLPLKGPPCRRLLKLISKYSRIAEKDLRPALPPPGK